jgi:hypothetical protein
MPIGSGRALLGNATPIAQQIAGGWNLSGIATLQTGPSVEAALSPTAGVMTATATTSRQLQFALKFLF